MKFRLPSGKLRVNALGASVQPPTMSPDPTGDEVKA